jgi:hypothetical protein
MKRTPLGEESEPETVCLQAVGALLSCVTACLLHNDPASYSSLAG